MIQIKNQRIIIMLILLISIGCSAKKSIIDKEDTIKKENRFAFDFVEAKTLSPVLDLAEEEGKLVFVDIYTDWCLPCQMMNEDVFTNEETAAQINKNFISYKVNAEKENGPDMAVIFGVKSYPTLLFLDTKGRILEKKSGAAYHTELLSLAQSAIDKSLVQ